MKSAHVHIEACKGCLGQMILPPLDAGSPPSAQWDRHGDCEGCERVTEFRLYRLSTTKPEAWELVDNEFSPVSLHVNTELLEDLCLPWTARDAAVESLLDQTLSVRQLEADNAALVEENNKLKGGTKATKAKKRAAVSSALVESLAASPAPKRAKKDEKRSAAEEREKEKKEKREKAAREKEHVAAKQQPKPQPKAQPQQAPVPAAAPKPRAKASREKRTEITPEITYLEFTQYSCKEISALGRELAINEDALKQPKLKLAHDVWSYITKGTCAPGTVLQVEEEEECEEGEEEEEEEEEEERAEGEEKQAEGKGGGGEGGDASAGELGSGKWGQGGSAAAAAAVAAAAVPAGDGAAKT